MIQVTFATSPPPSYSRNGKRIQLEGPPKPWGYFKVEVGNEYCFRKCALRGIHDLLRYINTPEVGLPGHFKMDDDEVENGKYWDEVFGATA